MKKLIALLFAAFMFVSVAALADIPADWQNIPLNDISMQFSIPGDFEAMELTEEDYAEGLAYACGNDAAQMCIYCYEGTLEETASELAEGGLTVQEGAFAEAGIQYAHICVTDPEDSTYLGICFMGSDGYVYMFVGSAETDEAAYCFGQIIGSIRPL